MVLNTGVLAIEGVNNRRTVKHKRELTVVRANHRAKLITKEINHRGDLTIGER